MPRPLHGPPLLTVPVGEQKSSVSGLFSHRCCLWRSVLRRRHRNPAARFLRRLCPLFAFGFPRSVCAVLGDSATRLALCHFLTTLSRCTDMSLCCQAEVNGMSPFLCPPAIESFHARLSVGVLLASLGTCPPRRAPAAAAGWGCLSTPWSRTGARAELPQESGSVSPTAHRCPALG